MSSPRVVDAEGTELSVGAKVRSVKRGTGEIRRIGVPRNFGVRPHIKWPEGSVFISVFRTDAHPVFFRATAAEERNTYRCPDLLVLKEDA